MVIDEVSSGTFISTDTIVPIARIVDYNKSPTYLPGTSNTTQMHHHL